MPTSSLTTDFANKRSAFGEGEICPVRRRKNTRWIFLVAVGWTLVLVGRLFSLQIANFETWQDWALRQHFAEVKLASERGPVFDRNNNLLAVSVPAGSVYVRPRQIVDKQKAAKQISSALGIPVAKILPKLSESKPFVWLERLLPRARAEKISDLKIPGAGYVIESRRYYPYAEAGSSVLGKVGVDGNGLSGIERSYEKYLHMGELTTKFVRDAYGNMIQAVSSVADGFELPKGNALRLTLDADMQAIVDEELEAGRKAAGAKSGMAILTDSESGEILAMSQAPATNFNKEKVDSKNALKNLVAETVYEPGSTMKPLIAAAAIEEGVVSPSELINCEHGRYFFAKHTIKDAHPVDTVSFHDVIVRSSNIGMTKVGVRLGKDKLYSYLRKFGFGDDSKLNIPGESSGILRKPESWALVDVATHSFGQGIAVTPMQMVRASAAIANGGKLMPLRLVDDDEPHEYRRVISEKTANTVKNMLFDVVEDPHGTGKLASISGVRVGGKTGTAQKANPGGRGYQAGAYMASFVGFVDASNIGIHNTYTLMVIVDEPRNGSIYGGLVAAPVFKRIMQRVLQLVNTRDDLSSGPGPLRPLPPNVSAASYRPL